MTIQKNPLPQYFHVVLFVIQNFLKLNLEFSLCLIFILITSGSKRVRLNEMDNPTGRNYTPGIETEKLLRNTKHLRFGCPLRRPH